MTMIFETTRLLVRQFEPRDLDDFAQLCSDTNVMRYVGDGTTLPRTEVSRWIDVCQQKYTRRGYGTSAIFEKKSARFLGYCGVVRADGNDFDELIYVLHQKAWGRGYATEAASSMLRTVFDIAPLDRIYATIHPRNTASIHVVEKLGFTFERKDVDDDGPVLYYIITRASVAQNRVLAS